MFAALIFIAAVFPRTIITAEAAEDVFGIFFTDGDNEYDIYASAEDNPLLSFRLVLRDGETFGNLMCDSIEIERPLFYTKSGNLFTLGAALFESYSAPTPAALTVNTNLGSYSAVFYIVDSTPREASISSIRSDGESGVSASSRIIISSDTNLDTVISASSLSNTAAYVSDRYDYDNSEQVITLNSSAISNNEVITVTLEKSGWTFTLPENDYNPEARAVLSVTVYNTEEIQNPPEGNPELPPEGNPELPPEGNPEIPPENQPEPPQYTPPYTPPETSNENSEISENSPSDNNETDNTYEVLPEMSAKDIISKPNLIAPKKEENAEKPAAPNTSAGTVSALIKRYYLIISEISYIFEMAMQLLQIQ
jgi:hypothetical protein